MAEILVIDDDARFRRVIAQILTRAGHDVRQAKDGVQGLAVCRERLPELVITDIVMPEKEGIETILELSRERVPIPVIAISGAPFYLNAARKLGAAASLAKPFSAEELLAVVEGMLAARQP